MPSSPGIPAPDTSYSLDGGTPVIYQERQDGNMHWDVPFYKSPKLPQGEHTLVITYLHSVAAYLIDHILVVYDTSAPSPSTNPTPTIASTTGKNPTLTTSAVAAAATSASASAMSGISVRVTSANGTVVTLTVTSSGLLSGTPTATLSGSPISVSEPSTVNATQNKTSTILGAALGVLGGIMVLLCILYLCRRVKRRQKIGSICECNTLILCSLIRNARCNADYFIPSSSVTPTDNPVFMSQVQHSENGLRPEAFVSSPYDFRVSNHATQHTTNSTSSAEQGAASTESSFTANPSNDRLLSPSPPPYEPPSYTQGSTTASDTHIRNPLPSKLRH